MSVHQRCALLAVIGALAFSPSVAAPSATAAPPGCDWNTDEGTQACMGGGPFDAGKGGQGDTYGPTGEPAYLQDTKLVFPRVSNDDLLKIGYTICKAAATGASSNVIESALVKRGVPEGNAGYLVTSAQMWLCPN